VVCKLDRLARSTRDLLNTLDAIRKAGASFRLLSDQWADTTTPHGRLTVTVLGGLAEFERRRAADETLTGIGKSFRVSHMTIARLGSD
jgi:DNA invertase Pin-like site-specific DNA recombinase